MRGIDTIVSEIIGDLQQKNEARDRALVDSRTLVRHSANAIRALHRGEQEAADRHLHEGRAIVAATRNELAEHPELYWAGYVQDAQKEFAEANLVAAMIAGTDMPDAAELGVERAPYLNGMAEAASEMRRYILDTIRRGGPDEINDAERLLALMDDVYTALITVDFPDTVTGGLRRTVDALRAVLERTRGDLTLTLRQLELARELRAHRASSVTDSD